MTWFFSPTRGRSQSRKEKPQLLLQEKQSPAFSSIPFSWRSDGQFSLGMKPAPFQQSLKQKVKKITTKHPFLPQIKQIWALVEKIQPSAHGGKGPEPRSESREGDAAGISPNGDHSFSKLGGHLHRRVTRGTRCLVPGGPGKQPESGGFGPRLGQTHEAGAAPCPGVPDLRDPRDPQDGHARGLGRLKIQSFPSFCLFSGKMGSGISSSFWRVIWRVNRRGTRGCWSLSPSPWGHPGQRWGLSGLSLLFQGFPQCFALHPSRSPPLVAPSWQWNQGGLGRHRPSYHLGKGRGNRELGQQHWCCGGFVPPDLQWDLGRSRIWPPWVENAGI